MTTGTGRRPRLADAIIDELAVDILRGELAEGQLLPPEPQLSERFGVSRTVVREAIKRLAHRKLVVIYPRSGSYVAALDLADLEAICDIRERLEGLAAERAATEARYEERQELQTLLADIDACTDREKLLELDVLTHRAIHRMAHNPYLLDTLTQSLDLSLRMWNLAKERLPDLDHHVHGQTEVLTAILNRNATRARTLAEAHVREFEDGIRAMF